MGVNYLLKGRGRFKLLSAILLSACAVVLLGAWTDRSKSDLFYKRVNLAIREIGHHLLLQGGDSTSRVLPVVEKTKGVFVLEFENEFVFQPDSLVALTQRFLANTELSDYTVTVHECHKPHIIYGFQINPPSNNIKPCRGRTQRKSCYTIEIAFADFASPTVPYIPTGVAVIGIVAALAIALVRRRSEAETSKPVTTPEPTDSLSNGKTAALALGKFAFDTHNQTLRIGSENIPLTEKECKVLTLLHRNMGQLTAREDLIQEVWTDEGVITGRSLDVFISKLRKKIAADPDLRITNIHGKGYRLEVVADAGE